MIRLLPRSTPTYTLFSYTTLFRSALVPPCRRRPALQEMIEELQPPPGEVELILRAILVRRVARALVLQHHHGLAQAAQKIEVLHALEERRCFIVVVLADQQDRKSTRLNSSH